jgi:AccI restriction endonuclease
MNPYVARLRDLVAAIPGAILPPVVRAAEGKVRVPTQAFSEFLINRELGDWAERLVSAELEKAGLALKCCSYGRSENLVAGDPGFKEHYLGYHRELQLLGKRPDLLVFRDRAPTAEAFLDASSPESVAAASRALAALEIRSSKQSVGPGRSAGELSFTPKIEDIHNIMRWVEVHGVPHYYVQVVFGAVYAISFERILEVLARGELKKDFKIESAQKSQFKATYYLPLTSGVCLTAAFKMPELEAFSRELSKGRILFGVRFAGGSAPLSAPALESLLGL